MGEELFVLGGALLAAGVLARSGRRIGLPTIPLFMAAGILLGPNTPGLDLVEHPEDLELLAKVGLILLLFHLGLEFSLGDLVSRWPQAARRRRDLPRCSTSAAASSSASPSAGARPRRSSSPARSASRRRPSSRSCSTELRRLANPESRLILGIIVVEDIFLALYLAVLQPILGDAEGAGDYRAPVRPGLRLPHRARRRRPRGARGSSAGSSTRPTTSCSPSASSALAVLVAGLAEELGVSDAIGAFMVGLCWPRARPTSGSSGWCCPLRDTFAAVFFFWFGLTIDPGDAGSVAVPGDRRGRCCPSC